MNLDRAQDDWALGRFPYEDLPELAARMLMQGHDGPAILELASFHMPNRPFIPPGLVDAAFLETGRRRLSLEESVYRLIEDVALDCLKELLSVEDLADLVGTLWGKLEYPCDSPLWEILCRRAELEETSDEGSRRALRISILQAAGRFLQSRRPR